MLGNSALAQSGTKAEYQVYTVRHKAAGDIEEMLAEMLSEFGATVHLVADPQANQILLRGPEKAQEIARQLIDSVDRPPARVPDAKPVVRAYPCPGDRRAEIVERLRTAYSGQPGVRIAVDPQAPQVLVLAPAEVHAGIPRQLAALGVAAAEDRAGVAGESRTGPQEHFVPLIYSRVDQVEPMLRDLFGQRLQPLASRQPARADYLFFDSAGRRVTLSVDRRRNGLIVFGTEPLARQLVRLIHALDAPRQTANETVRIVPLQRAHPSKVLEAVEAYRSGYRRGIESRPRRPAPGEQGAVVPLGQQPGMQPPGRPGMQLVSYLFQPAGDADAAEPGPGPADQGIPAEDEEAQPRRQRLRELDVDVEIEALPDLDVIILRGRDRDVDEISRIIEEIERLSAETEPVIDVYPLKHVAGDALVTIVQQVNQELLSGRQGRVSVTPLIKPNALLLIGWGEAVKSVKELIRKLDQPVAPETQLRVFRLSHAPAAAAAATVESFFSGRTGLGPEAQVVADARSNSLVVQAAPRDMAEVALLIERLDRGEIDAVNQVRIFKLQNSLALDLSGILQSAIQAARGGTTAQKSAALELLTIDADGRRLLKSGILDDVQITPDSRTNTLVVSAPAESIELIAALIERLDSPSAVAQIKVFRVINGDANSMVQMLRSLLPATAGAAGPQLPGAEGETSLVPVRFSVDSRTNSIIATGSEGDLRIIEALLLRLDEEDTQQRKNAVCRLRNAPALDVANAINEFLRSERQVQQAAPGALSPFQQIESEVVVVPEPVSNALIISATPRFFDDIQDLVEQLDAEPPQVMIQVLIAEVSLGDANEFGVELGLQDSILFDRSMLGNLITTIDSTTEQSVGGATTTTTNEVIQAADITPGFAFNNQPGGNSGSQKALDHSDVVGNQGLSSFAVGRVNSELGFGGLVLSASSESVSVLIRALKECRQLRVLSRPQVMTLDNQPAFIQVGKRVPRIVGSTISQIGQQNAIELENVGLILGVTPRISPDGRVVMEIDAEKSELGPEQEGIPVSISEGAVIRSPSVNLTMAQTTVSATNGETVVLGGLITKNTTTLSRRVPLLADIPLLGNLFRYDSDVERRTELLIILTPHVVRNPEEAEQIQQAEAARMHWCLGDVQDIHGPTMLGTGGEVEVVYPDLNPRGALPERSEAGGPWPPAPEPIPPGEGMPTLAEPPPDAYPPLPIAPDQIPPQRPPAQPPVGSSLRIMPEPGQPSAVPRQAPAPQADQSYWPGRASWPGNPSMADGGPATPMPAYYQPQPGVVAPADYAQPLPAGELSRYGPTTPTAHLQPPPPGGLQPPVYQAQQIAAGLPPVAPGARPGGQPPSAAWRR